MRKTSFFSMQAPNAGFQTPTTRGISKWASCHAVLPMAERFPAPLVSLFSYSDKREIYCRTLLRTKIGKRIDEDAAPLGRKGHPDGWSVCPCISIDQHRRRRASHQ